MLDFMILDQTIPFRLSFSEFGLVQESNFGDFFKNNQFYPLENGRKRLIRDRKW